MAGYGDVDEVMRRLERTEASADYATVLVRVTELNESLSRLFDQKVNRTGVASETRTIQVGPYFGSFWFYPIVSWPYSYNAVLSGRLVMP